MSTHVLYQGAVYREAAKYKILLTHRKLEPLWLECWDSEMSAELTKLDEMMEQSMKQLAVDVRDVFITNATSSPYKDLQALGHLINKYPKTATLFQAAIPHSSAKVQRFFTAGAKEEKWKVNQLVYDLTGYINGKHNRSYKVISAQAEDEFRLINLSAQVDSLKTAVLTTFNLQQDRVEEIWKTLLNTQIKSEISSEDANIRAWQQNLQELLHKKFVAAAKDSHHDDMQAVGNLIETDPAGTEKFFRLDLPSFDKVAKYFTPGKKQYVEIVLHFIKNLSYLIRQYNLSPQSVQPPPATP